jgi:hypothetical protein
LIVLDENIPESQRLQLQRWRVRTRKVGRDLARIGAQDADVVRLLHQLTQPTFFSLDGDFYALDLRHPRYCLVYVDVADDQSAAYIRRFLRHPQFGTFARRRGSVVWVDYASIHAWRVNAHAEESIPWVR